MNEQTERTPLLSRLSVRGLSLGLAAFILSLTLALINGFYALRGSEVVVQQPDSVLLYRDGEGDQSVLMIAIRTPMINTAAAEHGDVVMETRARLAGDDARFGFQSIVQPVLGGGEDNSGCELRARCIRLPSLLVVEYPDAIADIAGGTAYVRTFSFALTEGNCSGSDACERYGNFASAVDALAGKPLDARFEFELFDDGKRTLICRTAPLDADLSGFLADVGWINLPCRRGQDS